MVRMKSERCRLYLKVLRGSDHIRWYPGLGDSNPKCPYRRGEKCMVRVAKENTYWTAKPSGWKSNAWPSRRDVAQKASELSPSSSHFNVAVHFHRNCQRFCLSLLLPESPRRARSAGTCRNFLRESSLPHKARRLSSAMKEWTKISQVYTCARDFTTSLLYQYAESIAILYGIKFAEQISVLFEHIRSHYDGHARSSSKLKIRVMGFLTHPVYRGIMDSSRPSPRQNARTWRVSREPSSQGAH